MNTFTKDIPFLTSVIKDGTTEWTLEPIIKTATFKELSRTDRTQHKLHFKIISLFTGNPQNEDDDEKEKTLFDSDVVYDLTVKCIKKLLVVDEKFTATDKEEFLNDSGAIINFGLWYLSNKITPFFSELNRT
jgi:hypothetical protein